MHHRADLHRKRSWKLQSFRLPRIRWRRGPYSRILVAARSQQSTKQLNASLLNCVARIGDAVSKISTVRGLEMAPQFFLHPPDRQRLFRITNWTVIAICLVGSASRPQAAEPYNSSTQPPRCHQRRRPPGQVQRLVIRCPRSSNALTDATQGRRACGPGSRSC